ERLRSLRPEEPAPEDPPTPATRAPLSGGRFRRPGQDAGGEQRLIRPSGMLGGPLRRRMEPTDEAVAEPESVEPAEAVAPDAPPVNLAERPEPGGEIPTLSRRLRRADEA